MRSHGLVDAVVAARLALSAFLIVCGLQATSLVVAKAADREEPSGSGNESVWELVATEDSPEVWREMRVQRRRGGELINFRSVPKKAGSHWVYAIYLDGPEELAAFRAVLQAYHDLREKRKADPLLSVKRKLGRTKSHAFSTDINEGDLVLEFTDSKNLPRNGVSMLGEKTVDAFVTLSREYETIANLLDEVQRKRDAATRKSDSVAPRLPMRDADRNCMQNLRLIGTAFHIYADAHRERNDNVFPSDICDSDGKALLSWRVAILPYMEEKALFDRFRLDEPWDSPHNIKLLEEMPEQFRCPGCPAGHPRNVTSYIGVRGEQFALRPKGRRLGFGGFADGTSKSILAVECPRSMATEWTRPDSEFQGVGKFLKEVGGCHGGCFFALFADGHVERLEASMDQGIFQALLTVNAGDKVLDY
jgi:hypothetical protein